MGSRQQPVRGNFVERKHGVHANLNSNQKYPAHRFNNEDSHRHCLVANILVILSWEYPDVAPFSDHAQWMGNPCNTPTLADAGGSRVEVHRAEDCRRLRGRTSYFVTEAGVGLDRLRLLHQ